MSPFNRRYRPERDTGKPDVGQTADGVKPAIGMLVRQRAIRFLQVNRCVVMVVVISGLAMQQGVFKPLSGL